MSPIFNSSLTISFGDWREYRRNWGWLLALGVVSIILGLIALVDSVLATIVSMIWFGWVLLIAGIVEAVQAVASAMFRWFGPRSPNEQASRFSFEDR